MIQTIIGLGNIGKKYARTRHNLGFIVLNKISELWKIAPQPGPGNFYLAENKIEGDVVRLIWPTTYMNNSGLAVRQAVEAYKVMPGNVLVVYDDLDLPLGKIRLRQAGSGGSHNGMNSVIEHVGTEDIPRLRLAIGPMPSEVDPVSFVLGEFSPDEREIVEKMIGQAAEAVLYSLNHRLDEAMNKYNINPAPGIIEDNSTGAV